MRISNFHGKVVKKKKFLYQPSTSSHHHHIIICSCCVSRGILLIDIWPFSVCSSSTLNEEMISHTYYSPCFCFYAHRRVLYYFALGKLVFFSYCWIGDWTITGHGYYSADPEALFFVICVVSHHSLILISFYFLQK